MSLSLNHNGQHRPFCFCSTPYPKLAIGTMETSFQRDALICARVNSSQSEKRSDTSISTANRAFDQHLHPHECTTTCRSPALVGSCKMAPVPEWIHTVLHRQVIASEASFTEKAIALLVVGHILVLYTALCWLGASTISGEPRLKKRWSFTLSAIDSRQPRSSNGRVPRGPV